MKKTAALATALLILIPASAMFPFFASSQDPPATNLYSRSYSNYTLELGAVYETNSYGDYKYILNDYSVRFGDNLESVFDRVGLAAFANDRPLNDGETSASYQGTDVQFVIHRIPTGAMEISFSGDNEAFFDLPSGMSALEAGDGGVVVGDGEISSTLFLAGAGTLEAVPGGVLADVSDGSRLLFRANPGQDSFVASGIAQGKVAGEVFATSTATSVVEDTITFFDVEIGTIVTTNDTYTSSVSGSLTTGKVIIFNVDRAVLPKLDSSEMRVEVGGAGAKESESLASIFYETGEKPKYFVAGDGDWLQVHVYVPSFGGDTAVTFEPSENPFGLDEIAGAMAAVVMVCFATVFVFYRRD